jgi:hypothetical protein
VELAFNVYYLFVSLGWDTSAPRYDRDSILIVTALWLDPERPTLSLVKESHETEEVDIVNMLDKIRVKPPQDSGWSKCRGACCCFVVVLATFVIIFQC